MVKQEEVVRDYYSIGYRWVSGACIERGEQINSSLAMYEVLFQFEDVFKKIEEILVFAGTSEDSSILRYFNRLLHEADRTRHLEKLQARATALTEWISVLKKLFSYYSFFVTTERGLVQIERNVVNLVFASSSVVEDTEDLDRLVRTLSLNILSPITLECLPLAQDGIVESERMLFSDQANPEFLPILMFGDDLFSFVIGTRNSSASIQMCIEGLFDENMTAEQQEFSALVDEVVKLFLPAYAKLINYERGCQDAKLAPAVKKICDDLIERSEQENPLPEFIEDDWDDEW